MIAGGEVGLDAHRGLPGRAGRVLARVLSPVGWPGCPGVAEFAVTEFAAALGKSPEAGRRYLSQAVEGFYRLPDCWERLRAGQLQAWRLGMIADATMCLSRDAAGFVDTHVAPVAHKIGPAQLMRLVEEAKAEVRPRADRGRAAGRRRTPAGSTSSWPRSPTTGPCTSRATWTSPTRSTSTPRSSAGASELPALGSAESLDVRRSQALGEMARAQLALGFEAPEGTPKPRVPRRQVVLHVHLADAAVAGAGGLARLDRHHGPGSPPNRSAPGAATPTPPSPSARSSTWPSTSG